MRLDTNPWAGHAARTDSLVNQLATILPFQQNFIIIREQPKGY
jgi:hypothetical protein